jgi:hypothetical protein
VRVLHKLGDSTIAIEAEYAAYRTGCVIVIDVMGPGGKAEGAEVSLLQYQPIDRHVVNAISPLQMKAASRAMVLQAVCSHDPVVTRLAVVGEAIFRRPITGKFCCGLVYLT